MRKRIARLFINRFAARYDYDTSYLREMLDASPAAFFRFTSLTRLARSRDAAPADAFYAAKLVGALVEDCGPCTQLAVAMAREAGVADADIAAVIARDMKDAGADAALGFRFADALTRASEDLPAARDAVRDRWGEKGVIDLTFAVQISRVFPMVKRGLGHAEQCAQIRIGDRTIRRGRAA